MSRITLDTHSGLITLPGMYGKFFRACFQGSMVGAGDHVFAVWAYAISHAVKSRVELNPDYLWRVIGSTKEKMVAAIEYLSQPDPGSRHEEYDGRRLVKEGAYQYFLPQFERYQKIKNNDDLREQNRVRQARHREKKKTQSIPPAKDPINHALSKEEASAKLRYALTGGSSEPMRDAPIVPHGTSDNGPPAPLAVLGPPAPTPPANP